MTTLLKEEFSGITNNQAYTLTFNKRFLRPDPNRPGFFLGNTQRDEFLPYLQQLLDGLPERANIFDFGAGAGEILDLALWRLTSATISIEEPNPLLMKQYIERIAKYPHLALGKTHQGPIQDYYKSGDGQAELKSVSKQDLALAIHILYYVTNLNDEQIDPDKDLKNAVGAMYSVLKQGGTAFIALANQSISSSGRATRYYFRRTNKLSALRNHELLCASRERLLRDGLIADYLNDAYPDSRAEVTSLSTNSYLYGECRDDIVAMCSTGELAVANEEPFDVDKLDVLTDFVNENAQAIGLTIEERDVPQKGMYRSNQPQIITMIRRAST